MLQNTFRVVRTWAALAALAGASVGCGSGDAPPSPAAPAKPEELAAVLPSGVTLETPVISDTRYGPSAKTVGEALNFLNAQVKDGALVAGFVGTEIRFESDKKAKPKPVKKGVKPPIVIHLAH